MYEYDLADILKWFEDKQRKKVYALVFSDGSGGIYLDRPGYTFVRINLLSEDMDGDCIFEFDSLDDMVNRFDYLLEEG